MATRPLEVFRRPDADAGRYAESLPLERGESFASGSVVPFRFALGDLFEGLD